MSQEPISPRIKVKRLADRSHYDRETIYAILDEALICHVGLVREDGPVVIPTLFGRIDDTLYLHGSVASGNLRLMRAGTDVCITATIVDGIVFARSLFNSSMNYRSAVVFGTTRLVADPDERNEGLRAMSDHVVPGRWDDARHPNRVEHLQTVVVAVDIEEASAKIRSGGVGDVDQDLQLDVWAGVLPLRLQPGDPEPDPDMKPGTPLPGYVTHWPTR